MATAATWTPYGLEAIRVQHARKRRRIAALVLIGLALLILLIFRPSVTTTTTVTTSGGDTGSQFSVDVSKLNEPKDKPVTVSLSPGRVTLADTQGQANAPSVSHADVPAFGTAAPLNWNYYLIRFGPWLLLALGLWTFAKRRGKNDEVNFGVYKGAMPLEMISAHARDQVLTTRQAKTSIFGKRREDYLPEHVAHAAQEADA